MNRLKAAWYAFWDPALVWEGLGIRTTVEVLHERGEVSLITGEWYDGHVMPRITVLGYRGQEWIRRMVTL